MSALVRRFRRLLPRALVVTVVLAQAGLAVAGSRTPHREFSWQMFRESSTWRADIVRVTADGRRISVEEPWFGYRWDRLVQGRGLTWPFVSHHADSGIDATLDFLDHALDWVAAHTPADTETRYLEATVTYVRNTRGPTQVVLRSRPRETAP